ncbi:Gfo/Idh/MocA family protein [Streptomyces cyaneus]|uniref:Gfo/Idh/MocA family protein n=1 Tax=Streptomyces cyaneus TaxID=1904 RepID=UPI000FF896E9|nr:Gfo/Idh/MocA family oxidoreductase [Streptomyces cyaneus]
MKLGIIGLGVIGREFVAAIDRLPGVTLTAVCDASPARLEEYAGQQIATYTSHTDLISARDCEAVIVALPNHVHGPVVSDLLGAGLHVCCEKPLTLDPAEAAELVRKAEEHGVLLRTAFHRRFNRNLLSLRDDIATRDAAVRSVKVRYHEDIREHTGGEDWYLDRDRCGGGCIVDNGPNALDMARVVVGELTLRDVTLGDVRKGMEHYAVLDLEGGAGEEVRVELDWAFTAGEAKDIEVTLTDGSVLSADMLEGFTEFKSSLAHEYVGIVDDFVSGVADDTAHPDQLALVRIVHDALERGRRKHVRLRMPSKLPVRTSVVRLLFHETVRRGMLLAHAGSACIRAGDIHELVVTREDTDVAGARIDHVAYLGFIEFLDPAMLTRGDTFWIGDRKLGVFAGYDESHLPNHLNLILSADRLVTAEDIDLRPQDVIIVREGPQREFRESADPGAWTNQAPQR